MVLVWFLHRSSRWTVTDNVLKLIKQTHMTEDQRALVTKPHFNVLSVQNHYFTEVHSIDTNKSWGEITFLL